MLSVCVCVTALWRTGKGQCVVFHRGALFSDMLPCGKKGFVTRKANTITTVCPFSNEILETSTNIQVQIDINTVILSLKFIFLCSGLDTSEDAGVDGLRQIC